MDPKVKNMLKYMAKNLALPLIAIVGAIKVFGITDYIRLLGQVALVIIVWRGGLSIYRRRIQPAKKPLEFGKWAIITGSTSGIGKGFTDYLAELGMSILIISRSEEKLVEQQQFLQAKFKVPVRYIAHDFTQAGETRSKFYDVLHGHLKEMDADGGIGLLINNVGIANEIPKNMEEFSDEEIDAMIQCNCYSTVLMTRAVFKYMKEKKNGAIVSISSGSGNAPAPFLQIYSATKAFITQFSRSMKIEWWDSGVDFYVVTPFYVVSNLYKRKSGTIIAPMPIELVKGTLAQLGKKYLWQGHGYWFHGLIQNFGLYHWGTVERNRQMMIVSV
mmetsp:Transcript_7554/g.8230  ORF Transcript_7554/g.8230 Transcript_7554/m.8230 type:complete len:330 (-) Transcript_7554:1446-2435(-)